MSVENEDWTEEFLAAVDNLRSDDDTVRTTKHTSSVGDEGWATTA
jgi:hypothetical protein